MSKINKLKKELKDLSINDLEQRADQLRRDLFSLRLNSITTPTKDYKQFSRLRKDIARALTYLSLKKSADLNNNQSSQS